MQTTYVDIFGEGLYRFSRFQQTFYVCISRPLWTCGFTVLVVAQTKMKPNAQSDSTICEERFTQNGAKRTEMRRRDANM